MSKFDPEQTTQSPESEAKGYVAKVRSTKFVTLDQLDRPFTLDVYEASDRPRPRSRIRCQVAPLVTTEPAWLPRRYAPQYLRVQ